MPVAGQSLWVYLIGLLLIGLTACQPGKTTSVAMKQRPLAIEAMAATSLPCRQEGVTMQRFLALGDSYTIGEAVAEAERWPMQLAAMLEAKGTPVTVTIIARTGWTTDELAAAIQQTAPQGPYDLVSLLIGVNNQYRGRDLNQYQIEFRQLLEQAIAFAGGEPGRVIVLSIPDWGVTPFAEGRDQAQIGREIDAFNAINQSETEQQGAAYIDVTPISRQAAADPALIADDGLHPSGKMYGEWAKLAFAAACAASGSPK